MDLGTLSNYYQKINYMRRIIKTLSNIFYDVFDLVLDNLRLFAQNPYDYTQISNSNYILDSANVTISP